MPSILLVREDSCCELVTSPSLVIEPKLVVKADLCYHSFEDLAILVILLLSRHFLSVTIGLIICKKLYGIEDVVGPEANERGEVLDEKANICSGIRIESSVR